MKLQLTVDELNNLINPNTDRLDYLEREVKRLQDYSADFSRENRELRQKLAEQENPMYSHSSQLAQVMIAVSRFFACQKSSTAEALRHTLEELLPGQKILQLKVLREVTRAGLKEAKDFLEGLTYTLPSPTDDLEY